MGVHGLWRLIEHSGKPVPVETLENKVLAVDVSIWLHQAIKGFQDSKGAPIPNAHLLGIYHRVCKLLYFRIRPVFVFDGGVPNLKKETIAKRNQQKVKNFGDANRLQKQLLNILLKHSAVNKVISEKTKANIETTVQKNATKCLENDDIYNLPPSQLDSTLSSSDDECIVESSSSSSPTKHWDLHTIDEKSSHFKSLPADVRHEILIELKETRKQSSWGRIHELPTQSDDFSIFQMNRLLKRYSVQVSLEETEKEMGGHTLSLGELEALLNDHGVVTSSESVGSRIASDENTRYLLIKDVKKTLEKAVNKKDIIEKSDEVKETTQSIAIHEEERVTNINEQKEKFDSEYESDLQKAIQLSLQDAPSTSAEISKESLIQAGIDENFKELQSSFSENFKDDDFQSDSTENEEAPALKILSKAKNYMVEYSGLTPSEISKIIGENANKSNSTLVNVNKRGINNGAFKTDNIHSSNSNTMQHSPEHIKISKDSENDKTVDKETDRNVVELMSDTDSNSSCNFMEVVEKFHDEPELSRKPQNALEIIVQPNESLEEDLFSDIFSSSQLADQSKPSLETTQQNISTNNVNVGLDTNENTTASSGGPNNEVVTSEVCDISTNENSSSVLSKASILSKQHVENCDVHVGSSASDENIPNTTEESPTLLEEILRPLKCVDSIPVDEKARSASLSAGQLTEIKFDLDKERRELQMQKSTKERLAGNITEQMYEEAQELLQLFGVPYIVAPMEAEAQCAYLDEINLTDGTITDDSDIWLFGGRTVYKNFFNQSKRVMEFSAENIHHSFKLSRYEMILLALLVGSDYTTGVQGIGPVTALEILAAFPVKKTAEVSIKHYDLITGLQDFQKWFNQDKVAGLGRATLKSKLKNVVLTDHFPSSQVVQAYLEPKVESSKEKFSWAKPDIVGLTDFAREKFGWSRKKSEEILKPVLKRTEEINLQTKITNYFKTKHKIDAGEVEGRMSKRVKTAVKRMGEEKNALSSDEDVKILKQTKKRSKKKVKQIESEVQTELEKEKMKKKLEQENTSTKTKIIPNLHKKETIPQKELDKLNLLRSKMKAIETFRKSKQGPGYMRKCQKVLKDLKEAELSESSSD